MSPAKENEYGRVCSSCGGATNQNQSLKTRNVGLLISCVYVSDEKTWNKK